MHCNEPGFVIFHFSLQLLAITVAITITEIIQTHFFNDVPHYLSFSISLYLNAFINIVLKKQRTRVFFSTNLINQLSQFSRVQI